MFTHPLGFASSSFKTVWSQNSNTIWSFLFRRNTSNKFTRFGCFSCYKKFPFAFKDVLLDAIYLNICKAILLLRDLKLAYTYYHHWHKYIWTACSYVFCLKACVISWKQLRLTNTDKFWRIWEWFQHRWLLKHTKIHNNTGQQLTSWANTLTLRPSLIMLFEAEQAVQMYLCQWLSLQFANVILHISNTPH